MKSKVSFEDLVAMLRAENPGRRIWPRRLAVRSCRDSHRKAIPTAERRQLTGGVLRPIYHLRAIKWGSLVDESAPVAEKR
jgi:hypothetical protein